MTVTVTRTASMSIVLKLWSCSRTRVDVAVPAWTTSAPPARVTSSLASCAEACVMLMPGEQHVHAGLLDRVERQFLPADRGIHFVAHREREQRMVSDQHPHRRRVVRAKVSRMNSTWFR